MVYRLLLLISLIFSSVPLGAEPAPDQTDSSSADTDAFYNDLIAGLTPEQIAHIEQIHPGFKEYALQLSHKEVDTRDPITVFEKLVNEHLSQEREKAGKQGAKRVPRLLIDHGPEEKTLFTQLPYAQDKIDQSNSVIDQLQRSYYFIDKKFRATNAAVRVAFVYFLYNVVKAYYKRAAIQAQFTAEDAFNATNRHIVFDTDLPFSYAIGDISLRVVFTGLVIALKFRNQWGSIQYMKQRIAAADASLDMQQEMQEQLSSLLRQINSTYTFFAAPTYLGYFSPSYRILGAIAPELVWSAFFDKDRTKSSLFDNRYVKKGVRRALFDVVSHCLVNETEYALWNTMSKNKRERLSQATWGIVGPGILTHAADSLLDYADANIFSAHKETAELSQGRFRSLDASPAQSTLYKKLYTARTAGSLSAHMTQEMGRYVMSALFLSLCSRVSGFAIRNGILRKMHTLGIAVRTGLSKIGLANEPSVAQGDENAPGVVTFLTDRINEMMPGMQVTPATVIPLIAAFFPHALVYAVNNALSSETRKKLMAYDKNFVHVIENMTGFNTMEIIFMPQIALQTFMPHAARVIAQVEAIGGVEEKKKLVNQLFDVVCADFITSPRSPIMKLCARFLHDRFLRKYIGEPVAL